jgi:hypothetical protein
VRLKEVINDPQSKKIFMVLEYMAGGHIQYTNAEVREERDMPVMTVEAARTTFRDVLLGLEYRA